MAEAATKIDVKTTEKGGVPARTPSQEQFWQPLTTLRGEIDRLFDEFSRGWSVFPFGSRSFDWEPLWRRGAMFGPAVPAVDIAEKAQAYQITAELPGLDEKEIEVTVSDDGVRIKGEKKEEKEEKTKSFYRVERSYGRFERSVQLPMMVKGDKVEAAFKNGVLTVSLPKAEEAKAKSVKIKIE